MMIKKIFLIIMCAGLYASGCAKKEESDADKASNLIRLNYLLGQIKTTSTSSFPTNFTCMIGGGSYVFVNESIKSWKYSNSIRTSLASLSTVYSIEYLNNKWYAAGNNGIAYSSDGNNWTLTASTGINLRSTAYSGSKYITGGSGVALANSTNGIDWNNFILGTISGKNIFTVAYGNNVWVIGGNLTTPQFNSPINYSTNDGSSWTDSNLAAGTSINKIIFANNQFVSVSTTGNIATSTNGSSWTARISPTTNELLSIAFGNGKYVAVGASGTVVHSSDAITWQLGSSGETVSLSSIAYDTSSKKFYALSQRANTCNCGSGKNPAILSSSDGSSWTIELENSTTFDAQYATLITCK